MEVSLKKVAVIIGVVLLVAASVGAFLFLQNSKSNDDSSQQSESQTEAPDPNTFAPLGTGGESFEATITTTFDGEVTEATVAFDGQGVSEYNTTAQGQAVRVVHTQDAYYTCNDTQGCFKFDLSQSSGTEFNPDDYDFSEEDANDYQAAATKQGTEACESGACTVWVSSSYKNQGKTTIYVDNATNRIVKVQSMYDGTESTITYDYKAVTIDIPTDAEELPAGI